ncbi:hypothetical protein [Clostridium sp. BNL1100]|uniref:hypothetical protein n=1 Tax=Clostridium sp. BNL1100 TaxID=755731 RepID=UPI00024A79B9|nr:hypothetical protein [Clostridium sp. BNL1100]AEY67896.1 hypothetical protein Clo1100_3782 [Clostridium sp. BNL1100]
MGDQSRGKLIDNIIEGRITSVCNRECLNISYMELQNQLIETRKRIANDLRDDKLRLLEIYDKLNNDISELVFKALYIEGYKDGKS